jgi:hypothetical protein
MPLLLPQLKLAAKHEGLLEVWMPLLTISVTYLSGPASREPSREGESPPSREKPPSTEGPRGRAAFVARRNVNSTPPICFLRRIANEICMGGEGGDGGWGEDGRPARGHLDDLAGKDVVTLAVA